MKLSAPKFNRSSLTSTGIYALLHFDLGDGAETFPPCQPRGTGFESTTGATVLGEVRVGKQLLDRNVSGQHTIFLRA